MKIINKNLSMKQFIDISFEKSEFKKIINQKKVIKWIKNISITLKLKTPSLSLSFISLSKIKKLNYKYLKNNNPTDVLSFSQFIGEKINFINSNFLGDIVICLPYIEKNLPSLNHSMEYEVNYLILHGILHLIGYDHENKKEYLKMFKIQNKIFKKLIGDAFE